MINNNDENVRDIIQDIARMQRASQYELDMLIENTNRVIAHDAIVGDIVLELQENFEHHQENFDRHLEKFDRHQEKFDRHLEKFDRHLENFDRHQQNFNENQQATNAALNRLEAILLQLIKRDSNE